jgi:hypothetical protein
MTGSDGPVELRWVDANTPGAGFFYGVLLREQRPSSPSSPSGNSPRTASPCAGQSQTDVASTPPLLSRPGRRLHARGRSCRSCPPGTNQPAAESNRILLRVSHLGKNDWSFHVESQASNASLRLTSPGGTSRRVLLHQGKAQVRDLQPGRRPACATSGGGGTGLRQQNRMPSVSLRWGRRVTLPRRLQRGRLILRVGAAPSVKLPWSASPPPRSGVGFVNAVLDPPLPRSISETCPSASPGLGCGSPAAAQAVG